MFRFRIFRISVFAGSALVLLLAYMACSGGEGGDCKVSKDCQGGEICLAGKCRSTCQTDKDCAGGEYCDTVSNRCKNFRDKPEQTTTPDAGKPTPEQSTQSDGPQLLPNCGNGKLEPGEACEDVPPKGVTCQTLGFPKGTLFCIKCQLDTSKCEKVGPVCGNTKIEAGEECEGIDFQKQTCKTKGFTGGTLKCTKCKIDTSGCTKKPSALPFGKSCKTDDECASKICNRLQAKDEYGYCAAKCVGKTCPASPPNAACLFQVKGIKLCGWVCNAAAKCPDGLQCTTYKGQTFCTGKKPIPQPAKCGNKKAEDGEDCDGSDFKGKTCKSMGYTGGTLLCDSQCTLDLSACTKGGGNTGKPFGSLCVTQQECAQGLFCVKFKPTAPMGYCAAKCQNNSCPPAPPKATCVLQTQAGKICGWRCQPPGNCPSGLKCILVGGSYACGGG